MVSKRPQARYLAGLCSDTLVTDLLWTNEHRLSNCHSLASCQPSSSTMGQTQWRAPSWSWASPHYCREGAVEFAVEVSPFVSGERSRFTSVGVATFVNMVEAICEPATQDPTGRVSSGHLTVEGDVLHGSIRKSGNHAWIDPSRQETPPEAEASGTNSPWFKLQLDASLSPHNDVLAMHATFLPLATCMEVHYTMILQKVDSKSKPPVYRRIGMLKEKQSVTLGKGSIYRGLAFKKFKNRSRQVITIV